MDWSNFASKATSALGGMTDLINGGSQLASINSISPYYDAINRTRNIGSGNYYSINQLADGYGALNLPDLNYNDVRGLDDGQKILGVGTNILTGATAGLAVGGPWGALGGAVLGTATGIKGWIEGDMNAASAVNSYNAQKMVASNNGYQNLSAANDRRSEYVFRSATGGIKEEGGKLGKKQMTLQDFASGVLGKTHTMGERLNIVRRHCKGGTMIRFK